MLAFTLPIPVRYDAPTVLLPLLVAILTSVIGLEKESGVRFIRREELAGSVVMGRYCGDASPRHVCYATPRNIPWQPPPTGTVGRNCCCCLPGGADGCLQLSRGVSADVGKGNQRRSDDRRDHSVALHRRCVGELLVLCCSPACFTFGTDGCACVSTAVLCYPNQARALVLSQKKIAPKIAFLGRPNIEPPPTRDPSWPLSSSAAREVCHGNRR
jgi:hypothetical protein